MIVTCKREDLLSACQIVSQAVPSRTTMPVYQNVKAVANGDKLTLMGTDLEVGIRYELSVEDATTGEAVWPIARLVAILRESSDDIIRLESDDRRTTIRTSTSEYEMPAEDASTFADVADATDCTAELAAGDLQRMIRRTVFSAARDEGKYAMRGVLWDIGEKVAKLVATDGKRLAVAEGVCVMRGELPKGTHLVPPKAMALLERILADGDASQAVQVALSPNAATFRTDRAVITTRLVEGRFPPYRDVIPKKFAASVTLDAARFLSAVRQAAIMTDDESKRVTFEFDANAVSLAAQGATTGKSKVRMQLDYAGPAITTHFDPAYITEMLRVVDGTLRLDLVAAEKPAVFRDGGEYLYLVVPLV